MYFIKWEIQLAEALHPSQNHLQSFFTLLSFSMNTSFYWVSVIYA
jgi:hypothetical protein